MTKPGYPHYTNIAIAIPLTGRPLVPYFTYAFQNLHPPMNTNTLYMTNFNERHIPIPGPVADLRNWYVEQAIANECAFLFFIDEDVTPPPHALRQLMFQMEHHPEAWAIGGVVCHKAKPTAPMIFRGNGNGPYWDWKLGEFFEVSGIGMGCTLLRIEPFKTLEKPWFKTVDNMEAFWDGIPKAEVWTEDLYYCFPPNHKVYGDMLSVEHHKVGSEVVAHSGNLQQVNEVIEREFSGDLIRVEPKYGCGFSLTPNHPVEVERNGAREFIPAKQLTRDDFLVVPIPIQRVREDRPDTLPVWPLIRGKHVEFLDSKFRYKRTHADNSWFPLAVEITPELCSLAGYWTSEGSACGDSGFVDFTFHVNEKEYAADVMWLLRLCFNLEASERVFPEKNTRVVTCVSTALHDFFAHYFGVRSFERKVPEEVLMSSPRQVAAFLKSYWRGDGNKQNERHGITTTSNEMAHALRLMLIRLKIYPAWYERIDEHYSLGKSYQVVPAGEFQQAWSDIIECGTGRRGPRRRLKMPWLHLRDGKNYFAVAIKDLSTFYYKGPVYNLSVNNDHTYNVHGFSVHNCDKAIKAGGKIYADTSVLCDHWDMNTGQPTTLAPDSLPLRRATTKTKGQKKIVDLGCGESKYETDEGDVLTVDVRDEVKPDYRADLRKLPFANAEFDICYSSHVLEHFSRADVGKALDEWIRVLKPEGELRLIVPNLEWAADQIKLGAMNDDVLNVLYGAQTYGENFHQMGFTPAVLTSMLKERGFKRMDVETIGYNLCVRAWRQPPEGLPSLGEPPKSISNGHKKNGNRPAKRRKRR